MFKRKTPFAERLRRDQTDAEIKMWTLLRCRQFFGFKFRRQQPIGPYIVDFYCPRAQLVVELDGGQHADRVAYDTRRTAFLEHQGYHVMRFWDNDVLLTSDSVLATIQDYFDTSMEPSPPPLSQEGRGRHRKEALIQ